MATGHRGIHIGLALAAVVLLIGLHLGTRGAAAQTTSSGSVACTPSSNGLSTCTVTLGTTILPGGSFSVTLNNPNATFIGCGTVPAGGACSQSSGTVTFLCPAGCAAGSTYQDTVTFSQGAPDAQTVTVSGGLGSAVLPGYTNAGVSQLCLAGSGLIVACNSLAAPSYSSCQVASGFSVVNLCSGVSSGCLVTTVRGVYNACVFSSFANGCYYGGAYCAGVFGGVPFSSGCVTGPGILANCPGLAGFTALGGCNAVGPEGIIVNVCGFQQFYTNTGVIVGGKCLPLSSVATLLPPFTSCSQPLVIP